jgi:hypothetical protein
VQEIGLNLDTDEWFLLKTHYLEEKYYDIDITDKFAILAGHDSHRVIYHSIWEGFFNTNDFFYYDDTYLEDL